MREIKFRAWTGSEMVFAPTLFKKPCGDGTYLQVCSPNCPLMQYTGIKDKNGVEVYEGDILKSSGGLIAPCEYDTDFACFEFATSKLLAVELSDCDVIGNIHEHPELLETQ